MAHFFRPRTGERISNQTISVPHNEVLEIGLWGFREGGGWELTVMTYPVINSHMAREAGENRIYSFWNAEPGDLRIEAVASTRAVWDWIKVNVTKPAEKTPARPGLIPSEVLAGAIASRRKWRIPVSVALAQWALESTWGSAMPPGSNNPFGIKAGVGQPSVEAQTEEEVKGQRITIQDKFRRFASLTDAFNEHGRLLATNPHYTRAMSYRDSPDEFADALTGVYATASNYGAALKTWMKNWDLYKYDAFTSMEQYFFRDEMQFPRL